MNWLHTYGAKIDCEDLKVISKDEKGREVRFYRQREEKYCPLISTVKVSKLLRQGCIGYWCYTIDTQTKEEQVGNILAVVNFRMFLLKSYQDYSCRGKLILELN